MSGSLVSPLMIGRYCCRSTSLLSCLYFASGSPGRLRRRNRGLLAYLDPTGPLTSGEMGAGSVRLREPKFGARCRLMRCCRWKTEKSSHCYDASYGRLSVMKVASVGS
jgi:hypothetical protein